MFLDDELLALGRGFEINKETGADHYVAMLNACIKNLMSNIRDDSEDAHVISQMNRVNNTFKRVVRTLHKENRVFLTEDGFKRYMETTSLKGILKDE